MPYSSSDISHARCITLACYVMRGVEPYATQEGLTTLRVMIQKRKASSVGEFAAPYMGIDQRRYYCWVSLLTWYCVLFPYVFVGAEPAALTALSPCDLILCILIYMQYIIIHAVRVLVFVAR